MVNITLKDLSADNIYSTLLQTIENLCDSYDLVNQFGNISTANQQVVDYVLNNSTSFSMDTFITVENEELSFTYYLSDALLDVFANFFSGGNKEYQILSLLSDNLVYDAENKSFTISFHVKPKLSIHRERVSKIQYKTLNSIK